MTRSVLHHFQGCFDDFIEIEPVCVSKHISAVNVIRTFSTLEEILT